jgi:hypothetical protein
MSSGETISFGDNVRVRATPETNSLGLAGLAGQVFGETTPSATGVEVIGNVTSDYAVNVRFEGRDGEYWFAPQLLEFVDHAPGTAIRLEGVPKSWVRNQTGEWIEIPDSDQSATARRRKAWWQFWK